MNFAELGLMPRIVTKLTELGITEPTPIQSHAIPHAMNGRDVMGLAQIVPMHSLFPAAQ